MMRDAAPLFRLCFVAALVGCGGDDTSTTDSGKDQDSGDTTDSGTTGTVEAPEIVINEVLAVNDTINMDAAGEYDDWVELYNAGDAIVQLDGLYLTDNPETPQEYALPTGRGLSPGDFVIIFCDAQTEQQSASELHANFKLDKNSDELYLYYFEGSAKAQVDAVQWDDPQVSDTSAARVPDGSLEWVLTTHPTPAEPNQAS